MSPKVKTPAQLRNIIKKHKADGETVAFISGCFDVIHIGHINMLRKVKEKTDVLVVGVETDRSIRLNKGFDRPINNMTTRLDVLCELESVDYVFSIEKTLDHSTEEADNYYFELTKQLDPTHLVINPTTDGYVKERKKRAGLLGIDTLSIKATTSSTAHIVKNIKMNHLASSKQLKIRELQQLVNKHKNRGETVGLVSGCFDILHAGHVRLFMDAKKHVDYLIVVIESDGSLRINKGPSRPIHKSGHRIRLVESIEHVDYVFLNSREYEFASKDAKEIWEKMLRNVKPTHVFTNPVADEYMGRKREITTKLRIELVTLPGQKLSSTTEIAKHIAKEL